MAAEGVAAFVVAHPVNLRYVCGFNGSSGVLLVEAGRAKLWTDGRYRTQARQEVHGAAVRIVPGSPLMAAGTHLQARREALRPAGGGGLTRVAFEASRLTVAQYSGLRRAAGRGLSWQPWEGVVERLRMVKDTGEIALMRRAARLGSELMEKAFRLLRPGVREIEVAAAIEYQMRRAGASGPAFETIVASGARAALPHARATGKRLRKNELVVIDLGAIVSGYCSDLTRTVYLGRAPSRIRGWYEAVLEAQQAARQALRPGVTAGEVDAAARGVLKRAGMERYFTHSTGHGLGIEIHEEPRLAGASAVAGTRLEAGMVVTIEPGIYVEGVGGIRIEDDVLVTPRGAETLTTARRALLEL